LESLAHPASNSRPQPLQCPLLRITACWSDQDCVPWKHTKEHGQTQGGDHTPVVIKSKSCEYRAWRLKGVLKR
jgi:hypothetical protein